MVPVLNRAGGKSKYILKQVKGAVAAYSLDKLNNNVPSPCIVALSDASPNFTVPFAGNTFDTVAVENYIARNRVLNRLMTTDINSNGTADDYTFVQGAGHTTNKTVGANGQTLNVTAATTGNVSSEFTQDITIIAGESFTLSAKFTLSSIVGGFKGRLWAQYMNGASSIGISSIPTSISTVGETLTISNLTCPPTTTKVTLHLQGMSQNAGDTGTVVFTEVSLSKVPTFAIDDAMTTDANSDGVTDAWTYAVQSGITATPTIDDLAQKLEITNSTATNNVQVNKDVACLPAEVINIFGKVKMTGTNIQARLHADWYNGASYLSSSTIAVTTATSYTDILNTALTSPANTTKATIVVSLKATVIGGTGSAWFKNIKVWRSNVSATIQQLTDQSGRGNHAVQNTASNQPSILIGGIWQTDKNGKLSPRYDGVDDGLVVVKNVTINNMSSLSFSTIMQTSNLGASNRIIDKNTWYLATESGGNLILNQSTSGTFRSQNQLSNNNLSMAFFDYDKSVVANNPNFYINSNLNALGSSSNPSAFADDSANNIVIGNRSDLARTWVGNISELIIFNKRLSEAERKKLERNQGKRYSIAVT